MSEVPLYMYDPVAACELEKVRLFRIETKMVAM